MRLTQRAREIVDLLRKPGLLAGRLARPIAVPKASAARGHEVLLSLAIDVSQTPWRRAASACVLSPARTDNTIFNLTSTGRLDGRATAFSSPAGAPDNRARLLTQPAALALRARYAICVSNRHKPQDSTNNCAKKFDAGQIRSSQTFGSGVAASSSCERSLSQRAISSKRASLSVIASTAQHI
jgi:hypothetical protein